MFQSLCVPAVRRGTIHVHVFCASLALASAAAWGQSAPLTLQAALDQATSRSAAVQAGQAAERAGVHAAISAGQLPDPMLNVGIDNLPLSGPEGFSLTQDSMTDRHIGIEQEWVSADKRERRTTLANRKVDQERANTWAQLANVRRQTALAWLDAAYAQRALGLAQALVKNMSDELQATRASYSGVRASAADVTQAQLLRAQTVDGMLRVQQAKRAALIALGRWVAAPVSGVAGDIPPLDSSVASLAPQQLERVQPELIAAERAVAADDAATAVADSNRSPNWTWSVTYQQRGSRYSNMVSVGGGCRMPAFRQHLGGYVVSGSGRSAVLRSVDEYHESAAAPDRRGPGRGASTRRWRVECARPRAVSELEPRASGSSHGASRKGARRFSGG